MRKILFTFSLIVIATIACDDEKFLDQFPETSIGAENFFKTENDLRMYIYNLYSFPTISMYTDDGKQTTDNAACTAISEVKSIMLHSNPTSESFGSGWSWGTL